MASTKCYILTRTQMNHLRNWSISQQPWPPPPRPPPKKNVQSKNASHVSSNQKKTKKIRKFLFLAVFWSHVNSCWSNLQCSVPEVSLDPHSMCCILEANTGIVLQHSSHSSNKYGDINPQKNMFPLPNNGPKRILQTATTRCQVWNLAFVLIGR